MQTAQPPRGDRGCWHCAREMWRRRQGSTHQRPAFHHLTSPAAPMSLSAVRPLQSKLELGLKIIFGFNENPCNFGELRRIEQKKCQRAPTGRKGEMPGLSARRCAKPVAPLVSGFMCINCPAPAQHPPAARWQTRPTVPHCSESKFSFIFAGCRTGWKRRKGPGTDDARTRVRSGTTIKGVEEAGKGTGLQMHPAKCSATACRQSSVAPYLFNVN